MESFIFGKGTPWTYDQLQKKREIAEALAMSNMGTPSNVGEGLAAIGRALAYRGITKKADKRDAELKGEFDAKFTGAFGGYGGGPAPAMAGPSGPALPPPDPNSPHALGDDAMAALGKPKVATKADPASIKAGLVARGLPEHIADGFVMNFQDESGFDPGINEANPVVPGSRGGFGLYQLTGPRRRAYEAYAAERGVPVDDVDAQLDFLMMELQGPEAAAWSKISGAQNAGEAGAAIVNHFLRPAEEHRASRASEYLGGGGMPSGMDMATMAELAASPYATPGQKAVLEALIGQQTQAMDPMYNLELQKAQLELEQMQNPKSVAPEAYTERSYLAQAAGLEPGTPAYQEYLLTGNLPEEPAPAKPYSDIGQINADLAAGLITPEDAATAKNALAKSGVSVTVGAGETEFDKTLGKADATAYDEIVKSGVSASTGMSTLDAMESAMADPNFYSGTGSGFVEGLRRAAVSMGVADPGSVTSMESFNSLAKGAALAAMGGSLGAGFSNADRDFVEKQVPTLGNTPEGNREIIRIQKALLKRKQELAGLARQYATEQAANGKRFDQAGFEEIARKYAEENPLFGATALGGASGELSDEELLKLYGGE